MKKKMNIIDCTPTWEGIMDIHIRCLENPKASESAKEGARIEIMRAAKLADERNVLVRELAKKVR